MAILSGARVGSYEILRLLGAGGMGEVYQARDMRLNRVAERDSFLTRLDTEPCFDPFRGDPRYRSLLDRLNLA